MKLASLLLALALVGCASDNHSGGTNTPPIPPVVVNPMVPTSWQLGPIVNGENYTTGANVGVYPDGWYIDVPPPPGSVHYVTMATGPLTGKSKIVMEFRVETGPGAKIVPSDVPQLTSMLSLYFERANLCWTAACETQRWYSVGFANVRPLVAGSYVLEAPFDANWTAVLTTSRASNPAAFADTMANAGRVGFVLGGGNGAGHGVYAVGGAARIVITKFTVE